MDARAQLTQKLRRYYNSCERINEMLDNEEVTEAEAEDLMLAIDERFTQRIADLFTTHSVDDLH